MKIQLDPLTLQSIPDSKRVREEKVPTAMSSPRRVTRLKLITAEQDPITPVEPRFPESDELHLLELQVAAYLLETSLADSDLPNVVAAPIRERFCGRIFDLQDLKSAINAVCPVPGKLAGESDGDDLMNNCELGEGRKSAALKPSDTIRLYCESI
jgi:hypothetical protein